MKALYVIALLAFFASGVSCQNMTLMSGQVIAINELYKASNYSCCIPRSTLGDYTPIVRMDGSKGQYYVTADPDCKTAPIQSEAYPANYEAVWACGKCAGGKCPTVDGGLSVALPGDWCVDQNNKQDPNIVCSTQAPVCDEGYSGKCIAVPNDATQAVSGPSITLQSGQVVDMNKLAQEYQGQCCLPRTVINDFTPIIRLDNSNGNYFVSNDPSCNGPITNDLFPAMFEYIHVCDQCPPGGCYQDQTTVINGGITLVQQGGSCDPYNYYSAGCWGAAPMCSFGINQCIGIPYYANRYYDDNCYSTFDCGGGGWSGWGWGDYGYYRPVWWRPCYPIYRPGWWRPPIIRPRPPGPWWPIRPCPSDWRPGRPIPGWRPGNRPVNWKPDRDVWHRPLGFKPGRGDEHIIRPGDAIVGRFGKPGQGVDQQIHPPKPDSLAGRRAGPGVTPVVRKPDTVTGGAGAIAGTPGVGSGVPQGPGQGNRPSGIFQGRSIPGRSNGQTGRQDQGAVGGTNPVVDTRAPGAAGGNNKGQGGQQGVGTRAGGVGGNKGQGPEVQVPGAGNGGAGQSGPRQPNRGRGNPLLPGITPANPTITENGPGSGNQVGAGSGNQVAAGRGNQVGGNLAAGGRDNLGNLFGPGGPYGGPRSTTAPSFTQQPQQVFRPSTPRTREFTPRGFTGGGFTGGGFTGGGFTGGGRGRGAQPWLYPTGGASGFPRGNSFGGGPRGGRDRGFGK